MRSLGVRQRLFVELYLHNGGNASNAAREAGYKHSEHHAHRLVENGGIQAELKRRLEQHAMPVEEILARLTDIGRGDIGDFIRISRDGKHFKLDLGKARRKGVLHVIRRLKRGNGKWGQEIELLDPLRAIELLGRYHGLWNRHERALRRKYLRIIKRRIEGQELPFTLADLVEAAEARAATRRQEREKSADRAGGASRDGLADREP